MGKFSRGYAREECKQNGENIYLSREPATLEDQSKIFKIGKHAKDKVRAMRLELIQFVLLKTSAHIVCILHFLLTFFVQESADQVVICLRKYCMIR